MQNDALAPLFMPALCTLLIHAEDAKRSPLDATEVLAIRDQAAVIMVSPDALAAMAEKRGYPDIDPENCWYDWQMLRRELGRKPDLDPGARFTFVGDDDQDFLDTIRQAQRTLGTFRERLSSCGRTGATPLVKTLLEDPGHRAYLWLIVTSHDDDGFIGEIFELPGDFSEYALHDRVTVADADVMDWMVNDDGTLHGGFSLRLARARLAPTEQDTFDRHIGVTVYA